MDCFVLVDYDNLEPATKSQGLVSVARSIDAALQANVSGIDDLRIRLYGGWYQGAVLTRRAGSLSQEIGASFPIPLRKTTGGFRYLRCELAATLLCSPNDLLESTFRSRAGIRSRLTRKFPSWCINQQGCSIQAMVHWSHGNCPAPGCTVKSNESFEFFEQKLVDGQICSDVLYLALSGNDTICVVSGDDDLVPALMMGGKYGNVIHLRQIGVTTVYDRILTNHRVQVGTY
jgi:hypothetical protein